MIKLYENNGIITIRTGPQLKGVLSEIISEVKAETGAPSMNSAIVEIIRTWLIERQIILTKEQQQALRFDQMPRAGRK